jgi:hypothetical protein
MLEATALLFKRALAAMKPLVAVDLYALGRCFRGGGDNVVYCGLECVIASSISVGAGRVIETVRADC